MNSTSSASRTSPDAIAARIEHLPLGRFHRRFITLVSLGNFFDLYDIFVVAYIGAALQQSHFLTLQQFTEFIASGFFGMFVGTIAFGIGSDRFGRRIVFMTLLLLYSVFTLACAFAPSASWLIALRFFAGAGIGAEIIVIDAYVSEIVPSYARGRYVAITQVVGFAAVPVAALLARVLVPTNFLMPGWRWVVLIGSAGALLTWWFRRHLPESPRWLASRGRTAEAESILAALESQSFAKLDEKHLAESLASRTKSADVKNLAAEVSFMELLHHPYLGRTTMMIVFQALQTVGFYGFANWAPTFLLKRGFSLLHSLEYTMLIAVVSPTGPLLAAASSDRMERKWTIVALAILVAAFGLGFGSANTPVTVVAFGALLTLANYWFSAAFHAYQAELFPTRVRATAVGFTYSWSRLSAAFSSVLIAAVLTRSGIGAVFTLLAAAMCGVAFVIGVFGPRTNRILLEDLAK
ncbi:MAG: MFS transporter [Acidobacteria bacterium]|nr:MFS transporter [Acidobacteriota bacterium]